MNEPWLDGQHADLDPVRRLLACSLEQALAELPRWVPPDPNARVAFHLRHLAGSVDRLFTYARGGTLSEEQLAYLRTENQGEGPREPLLAHVQATFTRVVAELRALDPFEPQAPRFIGRRRLEVPLGLLLGHLAEHTQRHVGQLIEACRGSGTAD
jgi:hypothetical protein